MTHDQPLSPTGPPLPAEWIDATDTAATAASEAAMPTPENYNHPGEAEWAEAEQIGHAAYLTLVQSRCADRGVTVERFFTERDALDEHRAHIRAADRPLTEAPF